MYQLIPSTWRTPMLAIFAVLAIYAAGVFEWLGLPLSSYRTGATVAFLALGLIGILLGWSGYYSPWRCLWRRVPSLASTIYPDLNGVWVGTTSSNWSVIKALREAAVEQRGIDLLSLDEIDLQRDGMAMTIVADLYKVQIKACVANTCGSSYSLTASLDRFPTKDDVRFTYIYEQETPDQKSTDESKHLGAADLRFENGDFSRCEGTYWTRRSWRQGMNTAGRLLFEKVSDRYNPKQHDLLELARAAARGNNRYLH